ARMQALRALRERWRAVTAKDFEEIVLGQPEFRVARVRCVAERDLSAFDPNTLRPGHVSVVIVPDGPGHQASDILIAAVERVLDQRRLITCRHHVVGASWIPLSVRAEVVRMPQVPEDLVRGAMARELTSFFDPFTGGDGGKGDGWPFGRDVHISEVFQVLERTDGVDHVESLRLFTGDGSTWVDGGGRVAVPADGLIRFDIVASELVVSSALGG
ncbi:MAG TPA: hypothetical protein DCE18_08495, partial [Syntrophobacteraceae bacterium]|nr:hypothetical protein [Syntrophobacteraceae bacterium]